MGTQVTNDEEGLRGCWFSAVVQQIEPTHVLVAYDDLEDEETGVVLQEWFSMPGAQAAAPSFVSSFKVHTEPGYMLRPQPSDTVSLRRHSRLALST